MFVAHCSSAKNTPRENMVDFWNTKSRHVQNTSTYRTNSFSSVWFFLSFELTMPWFSWSFAMLVCSVQALARWWQRHRLVLGAADDGKGVYIWWCLFVNNQFRLLEDGQTQNTSDFVHVFGQQVEGIGKMLMCLDQMRGSQYTSRIWCIFEVFVACQRPGCSWYFPFHRSLRSLTGSMNLMFLSFPLF